MQRTCKYRWLAMPLLGVLAACGGEDASILVRVEFGDLQIPEQADSLCLGVWDVDSQGGSFGQRYALSESLVASLAVDPGQALQASMMARVSRRGIEVNSAQQVFDFQKDAILAVDRCAQGRSSEASERGSAVLAQESSVALSQGGGGPWIVVTSDQDGQIYQAGTEGLAAIDVAAPVGEGPVLATLAIDADNDCDDDLLLLEEAGPRLWRRELSGFTPASELLPASAQLSLAAVAFDFDGDLFEDLALAGASGVEVWRGGASGYSIVADATGVADLSDATGIASADLDGDGQLDLVVARSGAAGASDRVLYGDGTGSFTLDAMAVPETLTKSRAVAVADIDRDGVSELIFAGIDEPVYAYARDGARSYVDRSFLLLPANDKLNALSMSAADWNGDCEADLVIGGNASQSWASRGAMLEAEAPLAGALQVLVGDVLGSGERDLILVDPSTLSWWKR